MGKVHQLLAVEKDIVGKAAAVLQETITTFQKKATEFYTGVIKTYKPFVEGDTDLVDPTERLIVDTVVDKLAYTAGALSDEYDFLLQKEKSNMKAQTDLVIDGTVIAQALPVTFLLSLERRLEKLRQVIEAAPTLPTGFSWVPDEKTGKNVFKLEKPIETFRTRKEPYPFELSPATKEHPAKVVEKEKTLTVGTYTEQRTDSRVTSAQKSDWLAKLDKVLIATRKAVRTANDIEASDATIGKQIFGYILG